MTASAYAFYMTLTTACILIATSDDSICYKAELAFAFALHGDMEYAITYGEAIECGAGTAVQSQYRLITVSVHPDRLSTDSAHPDRLSTDSVHPDSMQAFLSHDLVLTASNKQERAMHKSFDYIDQRFPAVVLHIAWALTKVCAAKHCVDDAI